MADIVKKLSSYMVSVFGSRNEREIKAMLPLVDETNRFEAVIQKLSDKALSAKTEEFRNRLSDAFKGRDVSREEADVELNKLLPEAFAVCREASRRVIRTPSLDNPQPMRHFDVQLIGGIVLHQGKIAEMVTGEGKTLVATLAVYLNALMGKGVHVITVNDFLASRDCAWMGPLYEFLGLTAGAIRSRQDFAEKRAAYDCDVTFGKDSEFGFDFLRDNMRWTTDEQVQHRGLYYAIVDEVDSVLIDEARTPLIISGPSEESTDKYYTAEQVARKLRADEHFEIKEKEKSATLTEAGIAAVEKALGVDSIYAGRNAEWPHRIEQALRAHHLYKRDVAYVVKQGEIVIVDEFTGRLMAGRRWSDGLHQAIEAKEGLRIVGEDQTLATVTYQNFFRVYKKLAGMTGTALTEATEFEKIYNLDVISIPTNQPLIRKEHPDVVYRTEKEKFNALEEEIVENHSIGRPVLVGTISIERSELISDQLKRRGVKHEVLNAKQHERESQIVAKAGQLGNVTIATNMAGRGTDIVLGSFSREELLEHWKSCGLAPKTVRPDMPEAEIEDALTEFWAQKFLDEEANRKTSRGGLRDELEKMWQRNKMTPLRLCDSVVDLGGLHIVGTERHEARRIDNQLRGRAGRQGDPGSSRFFLSLEDDLMRVFASDRVGSILQRIGMEEGMAIEHSMVTRSIQRAQKKVEEHNFEIRKHLLEYDEVMDEQRKAIYGMRQQVVEQGDLKEMILEMIEDSLRDALDEFVPGDAPPLDRNGRPFCEWARDCGMLIELEDWQERGRAALGEHFASLKSSDWAGQSADQMAGDCVRAAMAIFMHKEAPFFRWNFTGLSRWARHLQLAIEAEEMQRALLNRILEMTRKTASEQHDGIDADVAVQICVEQAVETYLAQAVAVEEWNLTGLVAWAEAIGISLPVSQWQRSEEAEDEETLDSHLSALRHQLTQRLTRLLKNMAPADMIARAAAHEVTRRIALLADSEKGRLSAIFNWLGKVLEVSLSEMDVQAAVMDERSRIASSLTQQLNAQLTDKPHDECVRFCAENMVETFLSVDLGQPERDLVGLCTMLIRKYNVHVDPFDLSKLAPDQIGALCMERIRETYTKHEEEIGAERMRLVERYVLLQKIDTKWKDHLLAMDHLKAGIGLRGYAQVDPKVEYTREARTLFDDMQVSVRQEVTDLVLRLQPTGEQEEESPSIWEGGRETHEDAAQAEARTLRKQQDAAIAGTQREEKREPIKASTHRVGRNDPCPCGSGKKYKKCCGRTA